MIRVSAGSNRAKPHYTDLLVDVDRNEGSIIVYVPTDRGPCPLFKMDAVQSPNLRRVLERAETVLAGVGDMEER